MATILKKILLVALLIATSSFAQVALPNAGYSSVLGFSSVSIEDENLSTNAIADSSVPATSYINSVTGITKGSDGKLYIFNNNVCGPSVSAHPNVVGIGTFSVNTSSIETNVLTELVGECTASSTPKYITSGVVDSSGNIYFAANGQVFEYSASTHAVTLIAGTGVGGYSGDGGSAINAKLYYPTGIALDSKNNLYIADPTDRVVRKISVGGIITTVAGTGLRGSTGDGGLATSATFIYPYGVAVDSNDNLYIADPNSNVIRKVTASTGIITTVATVTTPYAVATNAANDIFAAGYSVYKIDHNTGIATVIAGRDYCAYTIGSNTGVNIIATNDCFGKITGITVDSANNIYLASGTVSVVGGSTATATTLSSSDTSTYKGASVTFTATVAASSGTTIPTGTVTFYDGTTSLGTGTLDSSGIATFTTTGLSIGTHSITATYAASGSFATSTSSALTETITTIPTNITPYQSSTPLYVGQASTLGGTVAGTDGSTPTSGTLTIAVDGTTLAAPAIASGFASASTSSLTVGTHTLALSYSGNSTYASAAISQPITVTTLPTTTAVSTPSSTYSYGTCVPFTITTTSSYGTPSSATITLTLGSTTLGTATLSNGTASISYCNFAPGTYYVTASYPGSGSYGASLGTATVIITKAPVEVIWTIPSAITYGTALSSTQLNATAVDKNTHAAVPGTFTYSPAAGTVLSAGTHTLAVTFTPTDATDYIGTSASVSIVVNKATPTITWATPAAIAYGTALSATQLNATSTVAGTFTYSPAAGTVLSVGTQALTVTLTPSDSTDYTTASASVPIVVSKGSVTINITTARSSYFYGDAVTFTFTAVPNGGGVTPTGTLTVNDNGTAITTLTLSNGKATYTTSSLTATTHNITAVYSGDGNYQ